MMVCVSEKENLNKILVFDMRKVLNFSLCPEIRSICVNKINKNVIIGTVASEIFECEFDSSNINKDSELVLKYNVMSGHYPLY
jgi:hypothetical protein